MSNPLSEPERERESWVSLDAAAYRGLKDHKASKPLISPKRERERGVEREREERERGGRLCSGRRAADKTNCLEIIFHLFPPTTRTQIFVSRELRGEEESAH